MCTNCAQSGFAFLDTLGLGSATNKLLTIGTTAVMLFGAITPLANPTTQVKAGAVCVKANQKVVKSGKTFVCKKSGKKLVWKVQKKKVSNSISAPNPNPDPKPEPKPTFQDNYDQAAVGLDSCRLRETANLSGAGPKGFPIRSIAGLPHVGDLKMAIIPVDFDNAPGVGVPGDMYAKDLTEIVDWAEFVTKSRLNYQPELVSKSWLRAPKGAEWYVCVQCRKGATSEKQPMPTALQELISLADPIYDFTNVKFVYFIFPLEAESKYGTSLYFHQVNIQTAEGSKSVAVYGEMGGFDVRDANPNNLAFNRKNIWEHLIHEVLHFQGIIGHGPINGSDLNIMTHQWGASKMVSTWEGFLANWYRDAEIKCLDKAKLSDPVYITMASLDQMGDKPISTMVKLSNEEVIVIERRSNGKYSNFDQSRWFPKMDNFTAYYVNVNKAQYRNDADPDSEAKNFWRTIREDGKVPIVKSVSAEGIIIEVVAENQLKISRS